MYASGVTFLSVRLSIVVNPNTSSGSSSSLSSGTSACWSKVNNGGQLVLKSAAQPQATSEFNFNL